MDKPPTWQLIMRVVIAVLCGMAFLLGALAFKVGAYFNFIMLVIMAACLLVPLARLPYLINKEIHWAFWKAPFSKENRRYWRPILLRIIFWALCGFTVFTGVVAAQFQPDELKGIYFMIGGGALFLMLLSLIPKRIGGKPMSIFSAFAMPFMIFILSDSLFPQLTGKGAVTVNSPFADESYMFHAGHNTMVNYHVAHSSQKHALDMVTLHENGTENKGDKSKLEDYACFGAVLIAPVDGVIERVVSDQIDQPIGSRDPKNPAGNHVVIKMDDTHYALLAHMKQSSTVVSKGDRVSTGQKLGECGNSGNTSAPHLHFQIQRYPDLFAEGGYTYPVKFNNTTRIRRGKSVSKDGLFYIRNDQMAPN
ncbi:peptidoglycan DD-metalloendopeptidase family protein [Hellea balneolensis]|uniref:peptidoglycan DD-metalloendopeptidase family protein n=1 Tax=Hellea balneolensis TaxID=287478 RepID=UPI00040D797E|nr:peptidoglycan DD-metalloendopeptidase family protein [Hellea balneolensis]